MSKTSEFRRFFYEPSAASAFNASFADEVRTRMKGTVSNFVIPENTHHFTHGHAWSNPANPFASNSGIQNHSAFMEVELEAIVANDLNLIERSLDHVAAVLKRQFVEMFFKLLSDTTDETGNSVRASDHASHFEALLKMYELAAWTVDRHGNLQAPTMMGGRGHQEQIKAAIEGASDNDKQRLRDLISAKKEDALRAERDRRARFARYGS